MYEWDEHKNNSNQERHGIRFEDIIHIFNDPDRLDIVDDRKDYGEQRIISFAHTITRVLIAVVHTQRENRVRIISARKANQRERKHYYELI